MKDIRISHGAGTAIMAVMVIMTLVLMAMNGLKHPDLYTPGPNEKRVLGKAALLRVSDKISPVAIYEVRNGMQAFVACGSYYTNSTGAELLLTVAHLFHKRDEPVAFMVRRLSPTEAKPSWCIKRIIKAGKQWGSNRDIAACELKPFAAPLSLIKCEVDIDVSQPLEATYYTFEEAWANGLTNVSKRIVTSLLSGEKIDLVGIARDADGINWYYVGDHALGDGESGIGFVDDEGALYVGESASLTNVSPQIVRMYGLKQSIPSLFFGPVKVSDRRPEVTQRR